MTTLLYVFITALLFALLATPLIRHLALHYGLIREPTERCSHSESKPRIGGVALYLAFFLTLVFSLPLQTDISILIQDVRYLAILGGATLMFCTGLIDDLVGLRSPIKLTMQVVAAVITWYGGVQINALSTSLTSGTEIGWLSLPITVIWIVLVTNAINLIDGLDGLAAGVVLFVSLSMLVLCVMNLNYVVAIGFAALAGSTLGFLRYNFNPASIFMGDCGSYFLGYSIAALSILGSVKGQATLAMLIPFVALGVPIFDALISPMRRFMRGRKMFSPDHGHLHHKLMAKGSTHRKAVLIIYAITLALSISAFGLVYARDEQAALILFIPAVLMFLMLRKIGYLNYLAIDKTYGWLRDMTDSAWLSHGSRTFLDYKLRMRSAKNFEDLWSISEEAFNFLKLDQVLLVVNQNPDLAEGQTATLRWNSDFTPKDSTGVHRFKIEYPLLVRGDRMVFHGRLLVHKYVEIVPIAQFTVRRIEQLQLELCRKIVEFRAQEQRVD